MNTEKTIEVLNTLIQINNDRVEGYETAAAETKETDLITLFTQLAKTSKNCNIALSSEVEQLNGKVIEGTQLLGKFFRVWMDVKAAFTSNDRKAILASCMYGEGVATTAYTDTLANNVAYLTVRQHTMLSEQLLLLQADYNKVQSLHDGLVKAL